MTKTLEEAIGCWTTSQETNSIPVLAAMVLESAKRCRRYTKSGNTLQLNLELVILLKRLSTTKETANDALRRLDEIITTNELKK